jgi:hypothetical protein
MMHEERFPPTRLSGCCRFSKPTLARTLGNGSDAPNPAARITAKLDPARP